MILNSLHYEQFGILLARIVALSNVGQAGGGLDHNSFSRVELPDLRTVVVGKKEFALDLHQRIAEPFVVCCAKSDIFVIILGFVIRGIQIKDGVRAVISCTSWIMSNNSAFTGAASFLDT